jgi:hypothetical protein
MASSIGICNVALAKIGARAIRSFDENNTRARLCEAMYDHVKDTMVNEYHWTFARAVVKLRLLGDDPIAGKHPYEKPFDCSLPVSVRPEEVGKGSSTFTWELIGNTIWTSVPSPVLSFTNRNISEGAFSASFVAAVAAQLAVEIGPSIRNSDVDVEKLQARADKLLAVARDNDAMIGSDFITSDRDPNNDSFVDPDANMLLVKETSLWSE